MANISVEKQGSRWIARCAYSDKDVVKAAGFRWDPDRKNWWTGSAEIAAKVSTPEAAAKMMAAVEEKKAVAAEMVAESRIAGSDADIPCPEGLAYLPYQRAGIATALKRNAVLFGDEMGLGKTIQAIGIINADPTMNKVLIVCPASLKLNWQRELRKWLVRPMTIAIATPQSCHPEAVNITILNYDILTKVRAKVESVEWDMLISDEAHYLKNPEAKRTIALIGKEKKGQVEVEPIRARRPVFLTGTPIPNRPIEGFPLFHYLDPTEFRSFWGYAKRYCDAQNNGYGWDLSGSSNLGELQEKLRSTIMIRRLKSEVLTELPAKRRSVIEIEANGATAAVKAESAAWERNEEAMIAMRAACELAKASADPKDYQDAVARLSDAATAAFAEISKLRHATAVAKIPYVIEHLRDAMEQGKVVVFAHHKDVLTGIAAEFGNSAVLVYGETPMAARQAAVDRFQADPTCRLFIGGILAAGVGLTLTAASHVVFAELDWVPGNVTQAEDRCHRIGQKDMVIVEHLVLEGSLDARMAAILVEKQEVIAAALDNVERAAPILPAKEQAATASMTVDKLAAIAGKLTRSQIDLIHGGLRILASMDDDYARQKNGCGFSKIDSQIGHNLAAMILLSARQGALGSKLVTRYRRQLPDHIVAAAKVD